MGYLKEKHGVTLLGATPPGTCPECAVKHDPEQPHNRDSLAYQYKFYDKYGRWPTWADAMAHCPPDVKAVWIAALKEHGVEVEAEPEVQEISIKITFGEEAPDRE